MSIARFYHSEMSEHTGSLLLDEENSKHIVKVLRMQVGDKIEITDGKGLVALAEITEAKKNVCSVQVINKKYIPPPALKNSIAISLLKNTSRFEWFLEKVTELGVNEIIPLLCHRTEKMHFRFDRMQSILISAMLQSKQSHLPILHQLISFDRWMSSYEYNKKFIAHCMDEEKFFLQKEKLISGTQVIAIGPEGDFTKEEVELAIEKKFVPVSLGNTRLRTETAGMVAATILQLH